MRRLLCFNWMFFIFIVLMCGCTSTIEQSCVAGFLAQDMYCALQAAWPQYASNSASCYSATGLAEFDEGCRNAFDSFCKCGYELKWVYSLTGSFLLEVCDSNDGKLKYFKLRRNPSNGRYICCAFDLEGKNWLKISRYSSPLRFAPIVADSTIGFTEMWDSKSDLIVKVPSGFHGLIQCGSGIFLLRKDANGEYYRWNAVTKDAPEHWKYVFPTGCNFRSSFFIALSSETGKSYAFARGLEPIPNSDGAMAISPCGAYRGRHFYKIWKDGEVRGQYYAWPEIDNSEPLSNGTETFDGGNVVYRNGKLVVLSHKGVVDVFDAKH